MRTHNGWSNTWKSCPYRRKGVASHAEWWQYLHEANDLTHCAGNGHSLEANRTAINLINRP
jgi:hypothetical protein